jgi:hypothetical protein
LGLETGLPKVGSVEKRIEMCAEKSYPMSPLVTEGV